MQRTEASTIKGTTLAFSGFWNAQFCRSKHFRPISEHATEKPIHRCLNRPLLISSRNCADVEHVFYTHGNSSSTSMGLIFWQFLIKCYLTVVRSLQTKLLPLFSAIVMLNTWQCQPINCKQTTVPSENTTLSSAILGITSFNTNATRTFLSSRLQTCITPKIAVVLICVHVALF